MAEEEKKTDRKVLPYELLALLFELPQEAVPVWTTKVLPMMKPYMKSITGYEAY
jgi:hypothetical protein